MKRIIILLILMVGLFSSIHARAKYQGIAGKGGKDVKTSSTVKYELLETYPTCTVTVYLAGTTTLASIYSDNVGSVKANPFTSNTDASYFFYADNGKYDIKFSGTGITTPFTLASIELFDNSIDDCGIGDINCLNSVPNTLDLGADNDSTGIDVLNFKTRAIVRGFFANAGNYTFNAPYQTHTNTLASGQTFTQLDQATLTAFPAYAGEVHTTTNILHANTFGHVFAVRSIGDICANRPAGHIGPPCYKVGLYSEGRSTIGQASDFSIYGLNTVSEVNAGHLGKGIGHEIDINAGAIASPTTAFSTVNQTTTHTVGSILYSGGNYQPMVGWEIGATTANNKFIRAMIIPFSAFSHRAIEVSDQTSPIPATLSGFFAISSLLISDASAITVQRGGDAGITGFAFRLRDKADTINPFTINNNGSIDFNKSTSTFRINSDGFGATVPSIFTTTTNDVALGANNTERIRLKATGNTPVVISGVPVYANNAAAIAGGLAIGSIYRTGADPDPLMIVH